MTALRGTSTPTLSVSSAGPGSGLATAGLILGYIFTTIMVLYCLGVIGVVIYGASTDGSTY